MAYDLLTTSGINSLVSSYTTSETANRITPLNTKKSKYQNIDSVFATLSNKLSSLKTILEDLKTTDSTSTFDSKMAVSSNTNFATVTASSTAVASTNFIRVNQLAKNDQVLSADLVSSDNSTEITAPGTHTFKITAGDGSGGIYTSNISVTFDPEDFTNGNITNQKVIEKIQNAINSDKAIVTSDSVTGSTSSTGSFVVNVGGTEKTISYSAGTYNDVIDSIVTELNSITGISAEKVVDGSDYQLKVTVTDSSKYIKFNGDSSALLSELGISSDKEIGASGLVRASAFSPTSSTSQLSISALQSGYDYRILSLDDLNTDKALTSVGLNLHSARPSFVQVAGNVDTPGYVYSESSLNAKLEFNGLNIERNSNSITDLLSGVTLNLKSVMQESDTTVSISTSNDSATIKNRIQSFITRFNDVYSYLRSNTSSTKDFRGLLVGDSTANSILSIFNSISSSAVSGIDQNKINLLSEIGISFDYANGLSISDSSLLDRSINQSGDQVKELFSSTNGIASALYDKINPYLGTTGYITNSRTNFADRINYINDNITAQQSRIDKSATVLRNNYLKLQSQLADLLTMQSMFTSFTSSLTSTTSTTSTV